MSDAEHAQAIVAALNSLRGAVAAAQHAGLTITARLGAWPLDLAIERRTALNPEKPPTIERYQSSRARTCSGF